MASVLITTVEHAYASAISGLKAIGRFVESVALPALKAVDAAAPTIEAVTALASPSLAAIERVGDAALGAIIKAIEDAGSAVAAGGLNVTLDAALVQDIKSIIPAVKAAATLPAPPATAPKS